MTDPYSSLARNNAWANETLHGAIAEMDASAFAAERPGFFPSLKAVLNHIHKVDLYYLDALERGGLGRAVYDRTDQSEPSALAAEQAETDRRLIRFCDALTPEELSGTRRTARPGAKWEERVDSLLLHLFQHQVHHRGQAHTMVLHAGISPPQLDEFHLDYDRAPTARRYFA